MICGVGSMLIGAKQQGYEILGNIEWRKYYHTGTFERNFPGGFMVNHLEDLTPEQIEKCKGVDVILGHTECITNPHARVKTLNGSKYIKNVKVGDLVLTHKGRFKPVVKTYLNKVASQKIYKINIGSGNKNQIQVTGDHPILTDKGWVLAKDLREGDQVKILSGRCKQCNKKISTHNEFCSTSCAVDFQWSNLDPEERQKMVFKANKKTREKIKNGDHPFIDLEVRKKAAIALGKTNRGGSFAERKLAFAMSELGIQFEKQTPALKYFIDFTIPEHNIAIEVDGVYWHKNREKQDQERQTELEAQGWEFIRFTDEEIKEDLYGCAAQVFRLVNNHGGKYEFMFTPITKIQIEQRDRVTTLYNLGVADDNSFICKNIVVHNCGNFSNLRANKTNRIDEKDMADIPDFLESVKLLKPKFFVMDNLARSLEVVDWEYYNENLPDYDIHIEWVSNHGYGNIQKYRKRMFIIGSRKELGFYFIPGEFHHDTTILDRLSEISPGAPNNDPLELDAIYGGWARYQFDRDYIPRSVEENRMTLREFQHRIADLETGPNFPYYNKKGEQKAKIGFSKINVDGPAMVLSGGGACYDNHFRNDTLFPFTIRERAKIQGAPDDFVFLPEGITRTGKEYGSLIKQTGKFMPVEFTSFVTAQIKAFLNGTRKDEDYTQERTLNPNKYVDENKYEYCHSVGYSNQEKVCEFCGSKKYCAMRKAHEAKFENDELF